TSQVAALAQVMLDPFYRTFEGFRILVEKDWLAAGHPFQWRLGHGQDNSTKQSEETSPIFLQFLDCMQQLVRLYPHYFEYSPRYLLTIADNLYNCRFGTFLGLSEADRDLLETRTRCPDLWTYLHYNRTSLCNPQYLDPLSEDTPTTHLFLPPLAKILRNVTLWVEYFHRWSSVPTVVTPPECISNELNVTGVFQPPKYSDPYPVKRLSSAESASADTTDTYAPRGPVDLNAVKHSDFDVPAMAFQYDYWEAAYRTERYRREELEKQLGLCPSPAVILDTAAAQDNELRCKTCNGRGVSRIAKADNPAEQSSGADAGTLSDEETEARRSRLTLSKGAEEVTPIVRVQEEVEATVKAALAENAIIVEQQQQVIDSLSRLLLEKGYDQVALEDIVGVVGV
ncbi:MTM1, partial [Symbiodinium microadriaticum]